MIYDIRTPQSAQKTLFDATGIPFYTWNLIEKKPDEYDDDYVEMVIKEKGKHLIQFRDFEIVFMHITTSAENCQSILQHGLLDLQQSYSNTDSELRRFLDSYDIKIDLDSSSLKYKGKTYDITYTYGKKGWNLTDKEEACWLIGRKFYYDYCVCGFLSVRDTPYGGYVHRRPEILYNIDELLGLDISRQWEETHKTFAINAIITSDKIVVDEDRSDYERTIDYLTKAYYIATGAPSEEIVLLKNGENVLPDKIIGIKEFEDWN